MAKLQNAVSPNEVRRSRDAEAVCDLELMNKVVSTINNRLEHLPYNGNLLFSFTGEGYPYTILEPVAETFADCGWDVYIYGEKSKDMGIKIEWPENMKSLKWTKAQ